MPVAQEIISQLGGQGRLKAMINAKNYVALENGLQFDHMPGNHRVNRCRVILNARDLYDIEFYRVRKYEAKLAIHSSDVMVGDLRETFRTICGLAVQL